MLTKDEKTIYIFALRYALPRHSYALHFVIYQIFPLIADFEDWEIKDMIDDCRLFYPGPELGGVECDRPLVDNFRERLKEELERRRNNND